MRNHFTLGDTTIAAGEHKLVDLPVSKLSIHTPITIPVHVLHGKRAGPTLFISAAIHGDELNGVEIIRRLLRQVSAERLAGTLLCAPIVNAYGFIARSRYLPDRRDLNRSFPGSARGSLAARLANLFLEEVVKRSDFGIDLHTAAVHRVNLPQIRVDFSAVRAVELAEAFAAPVMIDSPERGGSLRKAAREAGVDVLVYEGGEGLRFDEFAINAGLEGILGVMAKAKMVVPKPRELTQVPRVTRAQTSSWLRAPDSGVFLGRKRIGESVGEGEVIGAVANPYEDIQSDVIASRSGLIVGQSTLPIVNFGDALFHIASPGAGADRKSGEPLYDEDEIV